MVSREKELSAKEIADNLKHIQLLNINIDKPITQRVIKTAYHKLILINHPDKRNNSNDSDLACKVIEAYKALTKLSESIPIEVNGKSVLEERRDTLRWRLVDVQKSYEDDKKSLANVPFERVDIEFRIRSYDDERKNAQFQLGKALNKARLVLFINKYKELCDTQYQITRLYNRLFMGNFLQGKENYSEDQYKNEINITIEKDPKGLVAIAWSFAEKARIENEIIRNLRTKIQRHEKEKEEERNRLLEFDENVKNIKLQIKRAEQALLTVKMELQQVDYELKHVQEKTKKKHHKKKHETHQRPRDSSEPKEPKESKVSKPEIKIKPIPAQSNYKREESDWDLKMEAFKIIYKALYDGQSSWFKTNYLFGKENIPPSLFIKDLELYVKKNNSGRASFAWQLANKHYKNYLPTNVRLFIEIYRWSFERSGIFKVSKLTGNSFFSEVNLKRHSELSITQMIEEHSKVEDTRTSKIYRALSARSY